MTSPPMQLNNYLIFFIVFYYLLERTTRRNGMIYRSRSTGEFSLLVGHSWWFMMHVKTSEDMKIS